MHFGSKTSSDEYERDAIQYFLEPSRFYSLEWKNS